MNHPESKNGYGKILIAEDDMINQRLLSYQLKDLRDELIFANNGHEALHLYRENTNVRLILMDIQMPVMNGADATRKILEINPGAKVIGLSAYPKDENQFNLKEVNFVDYVTKPINKTELVRVIIKHLA
ncbi:response regulator [Maribellus sediminis]|uniref:response regulator n=1 Tax=Maribellus sediminis TaxID=2696285 RepID=UPI00143082BB|nr:response regulator [Maribellus sediminis]